MKIESMPLAAPAVAEGAPDAGGRGWRFAAGLAAAAVLWTVAWYWETLYSMAAIWQRSDTFTHGYLIAPISAWMIWQRRRELAALAPRPGLVALPLAALAGFAWLLGELGSVGVVQQYAAVALIPLVVWTVLGTSVARALAFPLGFLLFAVPFGEFLERPLMEHTADVTVAALRATGIPVYREGLFFTIPSGNWSVVEACSGLRYLIASVTLGLLYAYLTYRSLARRALFVVASAIVPIFANWVRAYMIVMIGHLSDMKYAVGVDHLIYGWLFFGVVMLLLFWAGSFWREDLDPAPAGPRAATPARARAEGASLAALVAAAVAAAGVAAAWPEAAARLEPKGPAGLVLQAPPGAGNWRAASDELTTWKPQFVNAAARFDQGYANGSARAGLRVEYYRNQRQGAELITSENRIVAPADTWKVIGERPRTVSAGTGEIPAIESRLRSTRDELLVWRWYWVDGQYTASQYWAKLLQAKSKLLGNGDDGAVVVVYAPHSDGQARAQEALQDFVRAMLPGITASLEHARRTRPAS